MGHWGDRVGRVEFVLGQHTRLRKVSFLLALPQRAPPRTESPSRYGALHRHHRRAQLNQASIHAGVTNPPHPKERAVTDLLAADALALASGDPSYCRGLIPLPPGRASAHGRGPFELTYDAVPDQRRVPEPCHILGREGLEIMLGSHMTSPQGLCRLLPQGTPAQTEGTSRSGAQNRQLCVSLNSRRRLGLITHPTSSLEDAEHSNQGQPVLCRGDTFCPGLWHLAIAILCFAARRFFIIASLRRCALVSEG